MFRFLLLLWKTRQYKKVFRKWNMLINLFSSFASCVPLVNSRCKLYWRGDFNECCGWCLSLSLSLCHYYRSFSMPMSPIITMAIDYIVHLACVTVCVKKVMSLIIQYNIVLWMKIKWESEEQLSCCCNMVNAVIFVTIVMI